MSDLVRFENAKVIPGGSTLTKRRGGGVGRPRTRPPRQPRVIPVWLNAVEIRELQAKPVAALPAAKVEETIPPFQRLSLAKQIEITYRRQQPRVVQKRADRRDRLVHTENVLNWKIEIWQKGATRNTDAPRYFYRTECLTVGAVGGGKGKGHFEYATPQRCLDAGRHKVRERETQWRQYGRPVSRERRYYKFRRYARPITLPAAAAGLDQPQTLKELIGDVALCPVCRELIDRNRQSLRDHFGTHVRKGLLNSREVDELLSFLVAPCHESRVVHA